MARVGRTLRWVLIGAALLAVIVLGLFLYLTRTESGVERTGRFALDRIRGSINGELEVGRITSGGLLRGVTLHDVALRDADGRPFLVADSARLAYRFRTLIAGDVAFDRLFLYSPEITIEQLPGREEWNFELIFEDTTAVPDTLPDESLVLIDDATVVDGNVIVRMAWDPDEPVEPDDTARMIMEEAPGGLVRVMRFEDVNGRLPRIIWEAPGEEGRLIRIGELATRAYIWETPAAIERVEGTVTLRDSLIAFDLPAVRLPDSEASVVGQLITGDEPRFDIEVAGTDLAFADFQWLYPRLPDQGGGALRFRMQTRDDGSTLWLAQDARLRTPGTEIAGSFGIITGDTLYFTNVDLQASPLDLELLQSLFPQDLPLEGLLIGTIEVEGPISSLNTRGDLRYRRFAGGVSADSDVRFEGMVRPGKQWAVRGLDATVRRLDLAQIAQFVPDLRLRGVATGVVRVDGSLADGLELDGRVSLVRDGVQSEVHGAGRFAIGGDRSLFDLRFDAEPIALDLLAEQFPGLTRVTGLARGPVTVTGSLADLRIDAELETPAGQVTVDGVLALDGPVPAYRGQGAVTGFRLDRVVGGIPETVLTARFGIEGAGDSPETLDGDATVEVFEGRVADIDVYRGAARVSVRNGLATVDTLSLRSRLGDVVAGGTFGIARGVEGERTLSVNADSLAVLEPFLFPDAVPDDIGFRRNAGVDGRLQVTADIAGNLESWSATGFAEGTSLVYEDASLARVQADFDFSARDDAIRLDGTLDSLQVGSRRVPHARVSGTYQAGAGDVVVSASGIGSQRLELDGGFRRVTGGAAFELRGLTVTSRDGVWALADSASGRIDPAGLALEPVVLTRSPGDARISLSGVLPWLGDGIGETLTANFAIEMADVRIGEVLRLAQTDTLVDGQLNGRLTIGGSARSPIMSGRFAVAPFRYDEAVIDSLSGNGTYRDRVFEGAFGGWSGGERLVSGTGAIPLDLTLRDMEDRRVDEPMRVALRAEDVPAGLLGFLAPGFTGITGNVAGEVEVAGTPLRPEHQGQFTLGNGQGRFGPAGVTYSDATLRATLPGGSRVDVYADFRTSTGTGRIRGSLDFEELRDPLFDLELVARRLEATRRRDVVAIADGTVHLGGRYSRPVLSTPDRLRVIQGELNLAEIWRQYQIVQLDTSLFQVIDTAQVAFRPAGRSAFLDNLVVQNASIALDRDVWLRSRELDVEVTGELAVSYDRQAGDVRLTGSLEALRGTYDLQVLQTTGRRFDIRGGTVEFVGTPGIDPDLDINATYRVRRRLGDPIDVIATVSGTLQQPRINLTSDSDPPVSESDLASYLVFGRSSLELTQSESDLISTSVVGMVRPMLSGLASTGLRSVAANVLGLPLDYVALTQPEYAYSDYVDQSRDYGARGLFIDTQLEVGFYAASNLFLISSLRLAEPGQSGGDYRPKLGIRGEYRFRPTLTLEAFLEERFARTPAFGYDEIDDRPYWGASLFREWGY